MFLKSPIYNLAQLTCAGATIATAHRPSNGFESAPPMVAASRGRPGNASGSVLATWHRHAETRARKHMLRR